MKYLGSKIDYSLFNYFTKYIMRRMNRFDYDQMQRSLRDRSWFRLHNRISACFYDRLYIPLDNRLQKELK